MKKLILLSIFCLLPHIAEADLLTGLVSYWKLDESSGDAEDVCGDNDGTYEDDLPTPVEGIIDNGQYFDGTGDYITLTSTIEMGNSFSLIFWWNPTLEYNSLIGVGSDTVNYISHIDADTLRMQPASGGYNDFDWDANFITNGNWYLCTLTIDGSANYRMYLNGAESNDGAVSLATPFKISTIGNGYTGATYNFDGTIDEVGVWEKVLDQEDIDALYNNGDGLAYPFGAAAAVHPWTNTLGGEIGF